MEETKRKHWKIIWRKIIKTIHKKIGKFKKGVFTELLIFAGWDFHDTTIHQKYGISIMSKY